MDWIAVVAMIGAIVTAGATIMLWRVTGVLAVETKRLAMATAQPQIVVTRAQPMVNDARGCCNSEHWQPPLPSTFSSSLILRSL
jgi:hypothetical protein